MAQYSFNKRLQTRNFTIEIADADSYAYFEHDRVGEDRAGGMWFKDKALTDYDGVFELPKEVIKAMQAEGYDMSYALDDEPDAADLSEDRLRLMENGF